MPGFRKKFHEKGGGVELGYNLSFRGGGGPRQYHRFKKKN